LIPKALIIAICIGVLGGAIFGMMTIKFKSDENGKLFDGSSLTILTEKDDYELGEHVVIKVKNSGSNPLTFSDASFGLTITGLDGTILFSPIAIQVISILEPREEKTLEWDQIKNDGEPVLQGTYKIKSTGMDNLNKKISTSTTINILK